MAIRDRKGRTIYKADKPCPVCGNPIPASWTEKECPHCLHLRERRRQLAERYRGMVKR